MKIAIVTDSTCDLPRQITDDLGITVVPLYVRFGTELYKDGADLDATKFYEMLQTREEFPSTSQPTAGDFLAVYNRLLKDHDAIVSLHISDKLSGTYASAVTARQSLDEAAEKVTVFDTFGVSAALGLVVMVAAEKVRAGGSVAEVVQCAESAKGRIEMYGLGDTSKYLIKGGRIGKARGFIATSFNIKPMIKLDNGAVGKMARARSRARLIEIMKEELAKCQPLERLFVIYSTEPDQAEILREYMQAEYPDLKHLGITQIGPVTGSHMGPGTLGVGFLRAE